MRTTLTIDGEVLAEFKRLAVETQRTLSGVIEEALRTDLARRGAAGTASATDLPVVLGGGVKPGADLADSAALQRLLDEGLPFARRAARRLEYVDLATRLDDLRVPLGNRLHALPRARKGQPAIAVNDQWRICFRFEDGDAYDVEITD